LQLLQREAHATDGHRGNAIAGLHCERVGCALKIRAGI
jgi:hypothetical protein